MTNEERAVVIPLEVDLEFADRIERELLRDHPPYTGTKDHNPTTEENAALIIRRLARRLREQGERIEGEVLWPLAMQPVVFLPGALDPKEYSEIRKVILFIIHPQEPAK